MREDFSPSVFVLYSAPNADTDSSGGENGGEGLVEVANALAADPRWHPPQPATLVVRVGPEPLIAILGHFDEAAHRRLELVSAQLHSYSRVHRVDYSQATRSSIRLAEMFVDRFGRDEISTFSFVGIPRGGLIVLGMLSYALDLSHDQLEVWREAATVDTPLVVVDDCALTGSRFGRFLHATPSSRPVIFATLYAHSDLRASIEHDEPRVQACLSAHDLHDYAKERMGPRYTEWRARLDRTLSPPRYWVGQTERLIFDWSEPDTGVRSPEDGCIEQGFRFSTSEWDHPKNGEGVLPVQTQREAKGPVRPAPNVIYGTLDDTLLVANIESGQCFDLAGVGADIWTALIEHGTMEGAYNALLQTYDVVPGRLEADLHSFVGDLQSEGLLL